MEEVILTHSEISELISLLDSEIKRQSNSVEAAFFFGIMDQLESIRDSNPQARKFVITARI